MRTPLFALVLAAACGASAPGSGDEESSGGPTDFPPPDFVEPSGAELHLELTRTDDVDLDVSEVAAGRTELLIDGQSVGSIVADATIGKLSSQHLLLFMRGAMVPGQHSLQLLTYDEVATESSELVQVFLEPVAAPSIEWEPPASVLAHGDVLLASGPGSRGVLGLVDASTELPRLQAWASDSRGWDVASARTLALPGLRLRAGESFAAVAAMRRGLGDDASLRAAWRIDAPGTAIVAVEVPWSGSSEGIPVAALVPDPSWLGAREWVDVVRPLLAGDLLLAELVAPRDAEQARPGDHVLASVVLAPLLEPGTPQLVQLGAIDVDRIAHTIDPLVDAIGASDTVTVLRDHREPVVLDIDRVARTIRRRASTADARDDRWTTIADAPVTTAAAFGSRIVAAIAGDARTLLVGLLGDRGGAEPRVLTIALGDDDAPASAAAALAWIDGVPIVLVPRGAADVIAVPITSDQPHAQALAGLACDAIVGPSFAAITGERRLAIACLRERELRLVALVVH